MCACTRCPIPLLLGYKHHEGLRTMVKMRYHHHEKQIKFESYTSENHVVFKVYFEFAKVFLYYTEKLL